MDDEFHPDDHSHPVWWGRRNLRRPEARGGWWIAVHDGVPCGRRRWRDFLRHKTAGAYRADRGWDRTRIHDSPAWILVRDTADSDQHRLSAIARVRTFRRRRLRAATRQRSGNRVDRAFR